MSHVCLYKHRNVVHLHLVIIIKLSLSVLQFSYLSLCSLEFSFSYLLLLFICDNLMHECEGTAAGCLLITLSNNPALPIVSSPRRSAHLLMETNSSSTRGRGVSKHPLSSYKKHWHRTETF